MCNQQQQEEIPTEFDSLILHLQGFYYEGMPLIDLAHRLRTQAPQFATILTLIARSRK